MNIHFRSFPGRSAARSAAEWCAADPGSLHARESATIPDQRCTASRCIGIRETKAGHHERHRAGAHHRRLRADGRRPGKSFRPRQIHRGLHRAGHAGGTDFSQSLFARRNPRRRCFRGGETSRREGDRHRRRLRPDVRRVADRAQRASPGARSRALPRRAGRRRRGARRRDGEGGVAPDQAHRPRAAGLSHRARSTGAGCRRHSRISRRQYRARRAVRAGRRRSGLCRGRCRARSDV